MKTLILGGGISGLMAACVLQEKKRDYVLLERCPTLGGLTRTVELGEFCFDYTGHFLHLSRYPTPADIPYADLNNKEWALINRRSSCYVGGGFVSAPIQYNLAELPSDLFSLCVESYNTRQTLNNSESATFHDFIVSGFGQALADLFLIPQNEKTMAISLDRLSKNAVRRFFPAPDEKLVRLGIAGNPGGRPSGYNSNFWYPTNGGIGRLVHGLRKGIDHSHLNQDVISVNLREKAVQTSTGHTIHWDTMFSSIPLNSLCAMTDEDELVRAAQGLTHSSTISFNFGLRGALPPQFADVHWLYVPGRSIPFYRVGFYSNIGKGLCTPGCSAIYVEVGLPSDQVDHADLVHDLQPKVIKALQDLGWVDARGIVCVAIHVMRHAYVHHTPYRDRILDSILARLREARIFPIGRYGLWDYTSMEDSMESARTAALELTS